MSLAWTSLKTLLQFDLRHINCHSLRLRVAALVFPEKIDSNGHSPARTHSSAPQMLNHGDCSIPRLARSASLPWWWGPRVNKPRFQTARAWAWSAGNSESRPQKIVRNVVPSGPGPLKLYQSYLISMYIYINKITRTYIRTYVGR